MIKHLYNIFAEKWYRGGTIYFYSDPHFGDLESYKLRFPDDFNLRQSGKTDEEIVKELDEMQLYWINKTCTKQDTLIILGDIGNIEPIKRIKAGYKVLILGNHDRGASYYLKQETADWKKCPNNREEIEKFCNQYPEYDLMCHDNNGNLMWRKWNDNDLFNEVYEGTLQISPKLILSHQPIKYPYCLNIHGHVHGQFSLGCYHEYITSEYTYCYINCVAEAIHYKPISLKSIIQSGYLKQLVDVNQEATDRQKSAKEAKMLVKDENI